ncbi:hypothetical protein M405DRAFT_809515, partial [Rhizopogon salebrosus TDB-379]
MMSRTFITTAAHASTMVSRTPLRIHHIPHIATTSKSHTTVITGKINAAVLVQQVRDVDGMPGVLL